MSFISYINSSIKLYEDIYELLSNNSSIPNDSDERNISKLKNKYNQFRKVQTEYSDMVSSPINHNIAFEPESWNKYVRIQNNGNHFMTIKMSFYIDHPNLNEYGVVIQLRTIEKHFKFKQNPSNVVEHKIKLASDVFLLFSDELVDRIRGGEIESNGRFRLDFDTNLFPVLRLPFHPEYISNKSEWSMSVLNSMDVELESFQKKTKKDIKLNKIINTLYG
tara:strand:- start:17000 stop:17659 length:660 start_codon:yes stop_codon:yes gene_type:complete